MTVEHYFEAVDAPPPPRGGGGRESIYRKIVEKARTQPGQWFLIAASTDPNGLASVGTQIKRGHYGAVCSAVTRRDGHGSSRLYIRYDREQ